MTSSKPAILTVMGLMILSFAQTALADGMFIATEGSFIYEPAQQAVIQYDHETSIEELTILPHFYGDSAEFAWVVPVPNQPEITIANEQIFWDLDRMTQAIHQPRDGKWNCFNWNDDVYPDYAANGNVEIISNELIGYYQTMVVSAAETSALMDSLSVWGFLHDENTAAVYEALDYYVDLGWYFVAMQVDAEALEESNKSYPYHMYSGGLDPVKFTFTSDEITYPMRISALSAYNNTMVNIYVITEHRMTFPGADTYYANKLSTSEIADLAQMPSLDNLFETGDFITKLQRRYSPSEMVDDVLFSRAPNDKEFVLINYSGIPWTGILLFGPATFWALIRRRKLLG